MKHSLYYIIKSKISSNDKQNRYGETRQVRETGRNGEVGREETARVGKEAQQPRSPSAMSRRLYTGDHWFSDGFTESEDWEAPRVCGKKRSRRRRAAAAEVEREGESGEDEWGPHSPLHRIRNIEAAFNGDTLSPSDKELEEEILREVEKSEKIPNIENSEKQWPTAGTEKLEKTEIVLDQFEESIIRDVEQFQKIEDVDDLINETQVTTTKTTSDIFYCTTEALENAQGNEKLEEERGEVSIGSQDSGVVIHVTGLETPSVSKPEDSHVPDQNVVNFDVVFDSGGTDNLRLEKDSLGMQSVSEQPDILWSFTPVRGAPLLLGHLKNELSGQVFSTFVGLDDAAETPEEGEEKVDETPFCSVYFISRLVCLCLVAAGLAGLVILAQS